MFKPKQGMLLILMMTVFILCSFTLNSWATDMEREHSQFGQMIHKLSRGVMNVITGWMEIPYWGVMNVITGWMEIPYNITETWKDTDPFTGFVVGGIKGFFWGWARTCTGLYDVVTFPFPVPKDYEPLMEPEYILPEIWGEPFPHYAD